MKDILYKGSKLILSSTAKNTYLLFFGNTLDAIFAFIFTTITFRILSTADFGIFSAINNFIVLAFSILDLGIGSGLINYISYHHQQGDNQKAAEYFKAGLLLRLGLAAVVSVLIIVFSWAIAPNLFLTQEYLSVVFAGIAIIGLSVIDIATFSLQAYQKFIKSALTSSTFSLLRVLLIMLVMVSNLSVSITIVILVTALASIMSATIGLNFLRESFKGKNPSIKTYKSIISFSGWIAVNKISSSISGKIDTQLLLLLAGASVTGIYSVAARLASFYAVIITSFSAVLAPKFAGGKSVRELTPFLKKSLLGVAGLVLAMLFGIFISKPFILLLFGPRAVESILPFQLLTVAYIPFVVSSLSITILIYYLKKTSIVGMLSIIQLIVLLLGNFFLIPRFHIYGPILALGISNTIVTIVSYSAIVILFKNAKSK